MAEDTELDLRFMNTHLRNRQFSEEFLAENIGWYDSWKCLRFQKNLSPDFCFRYLYDNDTDSADNWTDYNDVEQYLLKYGHTKEEIHEAFKQSRREPDSPAPEHIEPTES